MSRLVSITRRICACLLCFYGLALLPANGADVPGEPSGFYETIDVRPIDDTIRSLAESKGQDRHRIMAAIMNQPENFAPPVLYLLSKALLDEDRKDDATFWFFAGQLRGQIDANICADKSARAAIGALNQKFGAPIRQYAFTDIPKLTNTVEKVIAWEARTPCAYDRRWINLCGTNAINGDTNAPMSAPKGQWEVIRKSTRDDFRSTFYDALAKFEKMKQ